MTEQDLQILSNKLNLNLNQTKILVEEETDLYLILSQVYKNFSSDDLNKLSLNTVLKSLIIKHSIKENYDIKEQIFVSDTILKIIRQTRQKKQNKLLPVVNYNNNKDAAEHNFVICGFFNKDCGTNHLLTIQRGIDKTKMKIENIPSWLKTLNKVNYDLKKIKFPFDTPKK